jgi:hypothetical protein
MGKSTISMVIFNSYVKLPEGKTNLVLKPPSSAAKKPESVEEHLGKTTGVFQGFHLSKLGMTQKIGQTHHINIFQIMISIDIH